MKLSRLGPRTYVPWLTWEDAYLVANYARLGPKGCAKMLTRHTEVGIYGHAKAKRLEVDRRGHQAGELNPAARFTDVEAALIRREIAPLNGQARRDAIRAVMDARRCSIRTVQKIVRGDVYKNARVPGGFEL